MLPYSNFLISGLLILCIIPFKPYDHAVNCVFRLIKANVKILCIAINPENISYPQGNQAETLINAADFHICDGMGKVISNTLACL